MYNKLSNAIRRNKTIQYKFSKDLNRHFTNEYIQLANKHTIRCRTLLVIKEIQLKTLMKCHYTHVKMTVIKIPNVGKGMEELKLLSNCWWNRSGKEFGSFIKTLNIHLMIWSSNSSPRYLLKRNKTIWPYKDLFMNAPGSLISAKHKLETTQIFINMWMDKELVVYSYNETLFYNLKEWTVDKCNHMHKPLSNYAEQKKS